MLQIVTAPHPILSEKAKPVEKIDQEIHDFIEQMIATLGAAKDPEGVGLAAPQVGKSLQIFIAKPGSTSSLLICINPALEKIHEKSQEYEADTKKKPARVKLEGCLSLTDIWGRVRRDVKVKLSYLDENGKKHSRVFSGFLATIIQHEYDHLQGILFPKHVLEQNEKLYKSSKNEKGEAVFEEISI